MKVSFITLGCKVNQYDSQAMREVLENAGYECEEFPCVADVYVVNTCTVTQTGDKKSRQMISRAHSLNPEAKIVALGCYAKRAPDEVLSMDGVSIAAGTDDREKILDIIRDIEKEDSNKIIRDKEKREFELLSAIREGRTRAQLKIQDGCDRYCTYCIIPYTRGNICSRPLESVKAEFKKLADAGYKEVVITGIHLMSYGKDMGGEIDLIDAIEQASEFDAIERIRLGSLEPQLVDDKFLQSLAQNKKICHQFHLSLQSGSTSVLKRMARRYTAEEYYECVERFRKYMPKCAITTDIIVGFPGESEEEFQQTLEFAKKVGFSKIHVFPYSRREGTKAYNMPNQLSRKVKTERASKLIALAKQLEEEYESEFIGSEELVLFEERENEYFKGHTSTYLQVLVKNDDENLSNTIQKVKINEIKENRLYGELV